MSSTAATGLRMLAAAALVTGLVLFSHVSVQQAHRQGANDPQIQIAEDGAGALSTGAPAASVVPETDVDLARSLAIWVTVVDASNRPVASSARLDGRVPIPPVGVLEYARKHREHRISWEPRSGVRSAIVACSAGGAVVIAGRSLREVEAREANLTVMTIMAWLGVLVTAVAWAGLSGPAGSRTGPRA
jgi:hypothetical protein